MHLKDRSIIKNIMIPEKTIKIAYLNLSSIRPDLKNVRCVEIVIKNKTQYFADNTTEFFKKWDRYITKHYLITDFLELKEERNRYRIGHLNCFRTAFYNKDDKKQEIYKQYRDFIKEKFKTNYNNYEKRSFRMEKGIYAIIRTKKERIKAGSGEKMRNQLEKH